MPLHSNPSYPPELYPHSKSQLEQILTDYYTLTLELQTLQRHILKIQTQNENQHRIFNDQVEKLKLYIDQCENQIKKRQERQLILIETLKQLENSNSQDIQELKFSRKTPEHLLEQFENILKQKEHEWNRERLSLINDNQAIMLQNIQFSKQVAALKNHILQVKTQQQNLVLEYSQFTRLKQSLKAVEQIISKKHSQNDKLRAQNEHLEEIQRQTLRVLQQKQKILPISSSCPNCLKLNKMHEIELQKKTKQIQSLRKDVDSLLAFFDVGQ